MQMIKHCLKKPDCQLWQVLCDGNPCIVDMEIEAAYAKIGFRNSYIEPNFFGKKVGKPSK